MGCCPFLRKTYKIEDLASSNIEASESEPTRGFNFIKVVPPLEPKVKNPHQQIQNPTDYQLNELRPADVAAEAQSNLDIALSVSHQNDEEHSSSAEIGVSPNMVIIRHSKIRQSVVFQWQKPEFQVEQLFLQIDYDKLFKS